MKKYGLNMLVSADDQVKAYVKKIMSQLDRWMVGGKISKLVIVITDKDTGEHVERWQFDVSSPSLPSLLADIDGGRSVLWLGSAVSRTAGPPPPRSMDAPVLTSCWMCEQVQLIGKHGKVKSASASHGTQQDQENALSG